jgi:hypothetical protein
MKKFNKFDLVYESYLKGLVNEENAVDSHMFSNGLKIGTNFRMKPSFFTQSEAAKVIPAGQLNAIKELNSRMFDRCQHYWKVKTDAREMAGPNTKGANDINTALQEYGIISAAEKDNPMFKFMMASTDVKHVDICDFGDNLAPVLSPVNPYSYIDSEKGKPSPVNDASFVGLGNSPANRSLPTQNSKL